VQIQPVKLSMPDAQRLVIDWSDGQRRHYDVVELRRACPCATCNAERARSGMGNASLATVSADLTVRSMEPVGNYAYGITFGDGHDTGVYTLELLRRLGEKTASE
jgi:DUF971 family protein